MCLFTSEKAKWVEIPAEHHSLKFRVLKELIGDHQCTLPSG